MKKQVLDRKTSLHFFVRAVTHAERGAGAGPLPGRSAAGHCTTAREVSFGDGSLSCLWDRPVQTLLVIH